MRFGVQMFGLNPIFLEDKEGFLKRITAAGYRYLEPCLMLDEIPELKQRAWTPEDLAAYRPLLQSCGVQIHSCHVFTQDILGDLDRLIPLTKTYGIRQLVLPCPAFTSQTDYEALAGILTEAADRLQSAGIELLLHNGKEESAAVIDGISAYEWLLIHCGPSVGAQPDVGWLLHGGTDPEAFLWRYENRIRSLHYKDMELSGDGLRETGVGRGLVDTMACFQFARAAEVLQIVDQDSSQGDFLDDMDLAAEHLRGLCQCRDRTKSILCIMDSETGEVIPLRTFDHIIEAPNWLQTDDDYLYYNADGLIYKYQISTDTETMLDYGSCNNCNNDHVLSPDNTHMAVSHSATSWMSQIYILPIDGGEPRLITPNAPSFLHGWSPDGKELSYCAFRDHGNGYEVDIYAISSEGGQEWQLTKNAGFNDGPEYSPDGKHIWFISTRAGLMQCWRMNRDGSGHTQMTHRERNNWFPHVSPDGKQVVYLSYSKEGLDPSEHLPNMHVELGLMNADGTDDRTILKFFGGQGSINVNSWNPDSRRFAFVKYELEHK